MFTLQKRAEVLQKMRFRVSFAAGGRACHVTKTFVRCIKRSEKEILAVVTASVLEGGKKGRVLCLFINRLI